MDMQRIESLMTNLRLANECEAAAEMDVADARHAVAFAEKKLHAMECRLCEMQRAAKEASQALAGEVALQTHAPILAIGDQRWR